MDFNIVLEGQPPRQHEHSTEDVVHDVIMKFPLKSLDLGLQTTYLLTQVLKHVQLLITVIINTSLVESKVPLYFKNNDVRTKLEGTFCEKSLKF